MFINFNQKIGKIFPKISFHRLKRGLNVLHSSFRDEINKQTTISGLKTIFDENKKLFEDNIIFNDFIQALIKIPKSNNNQDDPSNIEFIKHIFEKDISNLTFESAINLRSFFEYYEISNSTRKILLDQKIDEGLNELKSINTWVQFLTSFEKIIKNNKNETFFKHIFEKSLEKITEKQILEKQKNHQQFSLVFFSICKKLGLNVDDYSNIKTKLQFDLTLDFQQFEKLEEKISFIFKIKKTINKSPILFQISEESLELFVDEILNDEFIIVDPSVLLKVVF